MNQKNQLSDILSRLQIQSSEKVMTEHELNNVIHDLQEVEDRLHAGHYQHSDYLARNTYDIPRRTEEFLIYMQGYQQVAFTWTKILTPLINKNTKHVLDLCPGWAPKIELALHHLGFSGTVHLWDVDTTSTKRVMDYMDLFKPNYKLSQIKTDLFTSTSNIKSDVIVANHIIDDLLLHEYCKQNQSELSILYGSETEMFAAVTKIINTKKFQREIINKLVKVIEKNLADGGFIIISQYAGLFEKANKLDTWVLLCKEIMKLTRDELVSKGYQNSIDTISNSLFESSDMYFSSDEVVCLKR